MIKLKNKLPLIATVAVILIAGIGGYYLMKLKQGPYPASTFISVSYKWGQGDTLINSYNSATGVYQFLDNRDSLIIKNVKLNANNVIFLHNRANKAGLWQLPDIIAHSVKKPDTSLRYEIVFQYEKKTKKVVFYPAETTDIASASSASKLMAAIEQTIKDAEERKGN